MTRIARGDRVARATDATQHVAWVVQPDGSVGVLCGNLLPDAQGANLCGSLCRICLTIEQSPIEFPEPHSYRDRPGGDPVYRAQMRDAGRSGLLR